MDAQTWVSVGIFFVQIIFSAGVLVGYIKLKRNGGGRPAPATPAANGSPFVTQKECAWMHKLEDERIKHLCDSVATIEQRTECLPGIKAKLDMIDFGAMVYDSRKS